MAKAAKPVFGRVVTAIVTPFTKRGAVDYDAADRLLKFVQPQCDGIVVGGTTGEGPTLTDKERLKLTEFYKQNSKRGFKVLTNIGTNNTVESVKLAKAAAKAGADGLMAVGPYYNKPNADGQLAHFEKISDATELPILLYNIPGRTGLRVAHEVIVDLAENSRVCAVKDATGDLEGMAYLRAQTSSKFYIYSGDDPLTLAILAVGGCGVVSVAGHIIGRELTEMIDLFGEGDVAGARELLLHYLYFMQTLFITTNPIPVKAALARLGMIEENFRLPMTPLPEGLSVRLEGMLREYEMIPRG